MSRDRFPFIPAAFMGAMLAVSHPALAQDQDTAPAAVVAPAAGEPGNGDAGATPIKGDKVYLAFHGKPGIDRIVATFVDLNVADPRVSDVFKNRDLPHLRTMLAEHICYILGGPCRYTGKDMKTAHKDMGLRMSDFNATVENMQKAMDKEGVPFRDQNRLLAKLAPQERLVVER